SLAEPGSTDMADLARTHAHAAAARRPRRADDVPTGRAAELLVSQFLMRAAITHVRRPALTIRSADRNVGTGATGWETKRALRRHCPPGEAETRGRRPGRYPG